MGLGISLFERLTEEGGLSTVLLIEFHFDDEICI